MPNKNFLLLSLEDSKIKVKMKQIGLTFIVLALSIIIIACEPSQKSLEKAITTRAGELKLKYENGKAALSGALSRSTPCVDWQISYGETSNIHPPKSAEFNIFNRNKGVICIQMLGEPQNISAELAASEDTHYTVKLEDEIVFSGRLYSN